MERTKEQTIYSTKHLTNPNLITIGFKKREISTIKNLCSRKSGPKFTKIAEDLLPPKSHHHAKFHRDQSNQLGEKLKILYILQYFGSPGGSPGPRVTSLGRGAHKAPPLATWKILSSFDDPSLRYMQLVNLLPA